MQARRALVLATLLTVACGVALTEAQPRSTRPLVAVMDFDYGTVDRWWGGRYDVGRGMADQVMDALVNDGTFRVVERKKLDAVLAEQDFAMSDRADPSAAKLARMGKVLGVRYIIAGSITKFSMERKRGGLRVGRVRLGGGGAFARRGVDVEADGLRAASLDGNREALHAGRHVEEQALHLEDEAYPLPGPDPDRRVAAVHREGARL